MSIIVLDVKSGGHNNPPCQVENQVASMAKTIQRLPISVKQRKISLYDDTILGDSFGVLWVGH